MRAALAVSLASDWRFEASLPFTAYEAPSSAAPGIPENGSGVTRSTMPTFLSVFDMFGGSTTIFSLVFVSGLPTAVAVATRSQLEERPANGARTLSHESGADGIDLVNISSGSSQRIEVVQDRVNALAFSADGSIVAVAGGYRNQIIRLYRTGDGRKIEEFTSPAARTYPGALGFAPDGRSLAVGLDDTTVLIFDVRNRP